MPAFARTITSEKIELAQKLSTSNLKDKQIAQIIGIGKSTYEQLKRFNFDYDAYREFNRNRAKRYYHKKISKINTDVENTVQNTSTVQNAQLELIRELLEKIVVISQNSHTQLLEIAENTGRKGLFNR